MKKKILALALLCVTLVLLLGRGDETGSTVSNAPGASVPNAPGGSDPGAASNTGESVFADPAEADAAFDALLKEALATGEPKQVWAEDFCTEQRREAATWRCELLDCRELCEELRERLLPDAVVKKKTSSPGGDVRYDLKMGRQKLICVCTPYGFDINNLTSEQVRELQPKAAEWLEEKCGLELREWTGYVPALSVYTACADGLPIAPDTRVNGYYGVRCGLWIDRDSIEICYPFPLSEQAGTISLYDLFSPEELRMTLEFSFEPSRQVVEAYRSCELCYMPDGDKKMLLPVWWVRGSSCDLETGEKHKIELFFDAETGQSYDLGWVR